MRQWRWERRHLECFSSLREAGRRSQSTIKPSKLSEALLKYVHIINFCIGICLCFFIFVLVKNIVLHMSLNKSNSFVDLFIVSETKKVILSFFV